MKKYETFLGICFVVILFILSLFFGLVTNASDIKCVDGDTFAVDKKYYRLSYIDTPEKNEAGYREASNFTCNYLKNNILLLEEKGLDKYGRMLVVVWKIQHHYTDANPGENLNELLIKNKMAIPFYGKTTKNILYLYDNRER